jgi:predicted oxidoreductase
MTLTNIKRLFESAGLEEVRPTEEALTTMGISRRRFTLLLDNKNVTPITVDELEAFKAWMEGIKAIDTAQIIGEYDTESELAESIGLTK